MPLHIHVSFDLGKIRNYGKIEQLKKLAIYDFFFKVNGFHSLSNKVNDFNCILSKNKTYSTINFYFF